MSAPEWLKVDAVIRRKPCGYGCRVLKIDDQKKKALVKDLSHAIWISFARLEKEWRV